MLFLFGIIAVLCIGEVMELWIRCKYQVREDESPLVDIKINTEKETKAE